MKRKIKLSSLSKQVQASIRKELAQQNGLSEVASRFVAELEKSYKNAMKYDQDDQPKGFHRAVTTGDASMHPYIKTELLRGLPKDILELVVKDDDVTEEFINKAVQASKDARLIDDYVFDGECVNNFIGDIIKAAKNLL